MSNGDVKILSTIIADSDSKLMVIPLKESWLKNYSVIAILCDIGIDNIQVSDSEWFYLTFNTTAQVSGRYIGLTEKPRTNKEFTCIIMAKIVNDKIRLSKPGDSTNYDEYQIGTNNYFTASLWTYKIKMGSVVKLIGIK